ncbi:hypothetical protein UR08_02975 [Listeria kieliensis]|uniref:MobA-like NTP transferase domain-containing protein n=1 Tax=Listeria kieliensis TaxID=1621700 RepID=A0A3D8TUF3_9LIST|nr:hypothetical protein UR08_02975 [Listeria kieliensis]
MVNLKKNNPLRAIVLAGGKSSRFGSDKAFYKPEGNSLCFIEQTVQKLEKFTREIFISVNQAQIQQMEKLFYSKKSVQLVPDLKEVVEYGPLGGLYSVSQQDASDAGQSYLILPVDLPRLTEEELKKLARAHNVYAATPQKEHFLVAHLPFFKAEIEESVAHGEHRVKNLLDRLNSKPLLFPPEAEARFFNQNAK